MASQYPPLVLAMTNIHDGWIVGSAADPSVHKPRDIDIIISFTNWQQACVLIPKNAKVNSFGGWKCKDRGIIIDIWPGDLGWLMQYHRSQWAYHPRTGIRLQRIESPE